MSEKRLKRIALKGEQFVQLLRDHQGTGVYPKEYNDLEFVVGDVTLPPGRVTFPGHTLFNGQLNARGAEFSIFDQTVNGDANFAGCKDLFMFGERAAFYGNLDVSGTGLTSFNHQVDGNLSINDCTDLEVIGPKTRVQGKLDARNCHHLESFNGIVRGEADFSNCILLRVVGPPATVGGKVNLDGTAIEGKEDKLFPRPRPTAALPGQGDTLAIRLPMRETYHDVLANAGVRIPTPAELAARVSGGESERRR
jgi:hypothetical protein